MDDALIIEKYKNRAFRRKKNLFSKQVVILKESLLVDKDIDWFVLLCNNTNMKLSSIKLYILNIAIRAINNSFLH